MDAEADVEAVARVLANPARLAMLERRALRGPDGGFEVTGQGERPLGLIGVDVGAARERRRAFAPACLDWTERRSHLAGALGAELCDRLLGSGGLSDVGRGVRRH